VNGPLQKGGKKKMMARESVIPGVGGQFGGPKERGKKKEYHARVSGLKEEAILGPREGATKAPNPEERGKILF